MEGRKEGWMDGWKDGRMDEWMNGWMDGWESHSSELLKVICLQYSFNILSQTVMKH
jgi:hypothetical protein